MLSLFNTLTRRKEDFAPLHPPQVGLYTCGPTVYNHQHVGNYRTYIFEDILKRTLAALGYRVRHVMNITDVGHLVSQADEGEDKMEIGAAREGKTAWEIARFYTEAFLSDCAQLRILAPDVLCRATDHIPEQIELIKRLESRGLIYKTSDGIYFDAEKFPGYGRLAGAEHVSGIKAGARVRHSREKRSAHDFALWKFSSPHKKRQMEWPSPWGIGFPGWHIECSAMSMKYLGETLDIHCGGVDHIPIHHTNEIAQAEAATGKPFARFWLHGEFLLMNATKMAKSAGGFVTMEEIKKRGFDPLDYRYHCLTAHYRRQLDFTWETLEASKQARRRLRAAALELQGVEVRPACADELKRFQACLSDDLNMPEALAVVWESLKSDLPPGARRALLDTAELIFGIGLFDLKDEKLDPELAEMISSRERARRARDFPLSDKIRSALESRGILVQDTPSGQKWRRK